MSAARPQVRHRAHDKPEPRRIVTGHMVPVFGERDETCARYEDCLAAHVHGHKPKGGGGRWDPDGERTGETPASCAPACRWQLRRVESATDYTGGGDGPTFPEGGCA